MNTYLFFLYSKENGKFDKYQISKMDKTPEEVQNIVNNFTVTNKHNTAKIISDPDVLSALLQKESYDTIKNSCANLLEQIEGMDTEIRDMVCSFENFKEKVDKELKERCQE